MYLQQVKVGNIGKENLMKNPHLLLLLLLIFSNTLFAYEWTSYGPIATPISKADWHIPVILSNGHIGLQEGGNWFYYTYSNINVIDFTRFDANRLLVVLGSGSNSDGVYFFNLHNHSFQVQSWMMNPLFIKYCSTDSMYYVGGWEGLFKSDDGTAWTEVVVPGTGSVSDFAYQGQNFVVSKNNQTWYSSNSGITWTQSQFNDYRHGFRFMDNGSLYSIMNIGSYSDGTWKSIDQGATWDVVFWTLHLSCVGPLFNERLPFGWCNGFGQETGVGLTIAGGDYELLNDGLPNLNINCIDTFDLINTPSFWVGTDSGAFYCTGFMTENEDQVIPSPKVKLSNHPNPFSHSTKIEISGIITPPGSRIDIFNIRGEIVQSLETGNSTTVEWNGENEHGSQVANGIYLCRFRSGDHILATRQILKVR